MIAWPGRGVLSWGMVKWTDLWPEGNPTNLLAVSQLRFGWRQSLGSGWVVLIVPPPFDMRPREEEINLPVAEVCVKKCCGKGAESVSNPGWKLG